MITECQQYDPELQEINKNVTFKFFNHQTHGLNPTRIQNKLQDKY